MADVLKKVPVREQDPKVRATNFEEVCYGYNQEEAMEEASRCINCKNAKCIQGCPVGINIPAFVHEVKEGNIEEAYKIIGQSSALPAVCGRVCPQESQCEGKCIRGIKGESISIGKLERFVADYALEHDIKPAGAEVKNGHKVAVIGSGPSTHANLISSPTWRRHAPHIPVPSTMIGFMLTIVGISSFFVSRQTNFIMIIGPIATQTSYLLPSATSASIFVVTIPACPYVPSSVHG